MTSAAPGRRSFFAAFGPGLVAGGSANDPTTVATLAVVGATTMYSLGWLVVLVLPMLAIVQSVAASIAAVFGCNVQAAICRAYGRRVGALSLLAVVVVGTFTLAADLKAGAEALTLLIGLPAWAWTVPIAVLTGCLLAGTSYLRIERILAAFTVVFFCYVGAAVLAHPDWSAVSRGILVPHVLGTPAYAAGAIALMGTTLTSYTYYWGSIEVAERRPERAELRAVKADATIGMLLTGSSFLFILIATAATSGVRGLTIDTALDAAAALQPLAGSLARILFGIGLLASAAIAIPVLAAVNGYVITTTIGVRGSLQAKPREAPAFYGIVFGSLGLAAIVALLPLNTIGLLFWASIAGGVAAPLTLILMLAVARNRRVFGERAIGGPLAVGGWLVAIAISLAALAFLVSTFAYKPN